MLDSVFLLSPGLFVGTLRYNNIQSGYMTSIRFLSKKWFSVEEYLFSGKMHLTPPIILGRLTDLNLGQPVVNFCGKQKTVLVSPSSIRSIQLFIRLLTVNTLELVVKCL